MRILILVVRRFPEELRHGFGYLICRLILNTSREAIPGGTEAWFWVSDMPANSFTRFALDTSEVEIIDKKIDLPELSFDKNGWVTSARWKGMDEPLFTEGLADFMVVHFNDMDRWSQGDICTLERYG